MKQHGIAYKFDLTMLGDMNDLWLKKKKNGNSLYYQVNLKKQKKKGYWNSKLETFKHMGPK